MKLGKKNVQQIQEEMMKAAHEVAEKYGVELNSKGGTVESSTEAILKFEILSADPEQQRKDWDSKAENVGVPKGMWGWRFTEKGKTLQFVKIDEGKPKYPVIAEDDQGNRYKLPVLMVKRIAKQAKHPDVV